MLRTVMKLRGRGAGELRDRVSQAAARWLERQGLGDARELTRDALTDAIGPDDGGPVVRGPFFASLDDRQATLAALLEIDPQFETTVRTRADRIMKDQYDLLGYGNLAFGSPVDWWLEPVAGVRAPDAHWSAIAYLDPSIVGDHKLVWELGRHRALVALGQAAWCTGDHRYVNASAQMLEYWMDRNPPKRGIHWASSLEVSIRSIAWVWTLALLGDRLSRATRRRATGYLAVSAAHVERYLSTWFSPNTHLTGEALGLFVVGTTLPQCRGADQWRTTGARILLDWLPRHVRADGTYVEQSSWYHRYTTDFYLTFLVLAARSGLASGNEVREPLGRLLDVLAWLTRPDGSMPLIGDDDGGRLMFLDEQPAHVTRGTLATGAALLERPDLAAVAQRPTTELAWLLGPGGLESFQRLAPRYPGDNARAFSSGGLYVMRSGWDTGASMLTVDAGPHGFLNAGHAHADALSIDLTVLGQPLFVDPGTFTYTVSPALRNHFRSTRAHCAATAGGKDSADVAGPFSWATRCEAQADVWVAGMDVVLFSGTHDGFQRLSPPVRYRRSIVFLAPLLWIIRDEIDTDARELAVHWQCAEGIHVRVADGRAILTHNDDAIATVWTHEHSPVQVVEGWVSPSYGRKVPAPHLVVRPQSGATPFLITFIAANGADVRVSSSGSAGTMLNVVAGDGSGTILFGGNGEGEVVTDARLGWIERDPRTAEPVAVLVAGARHLAINGENVSVNARGDGRWVASS